MPVHGTLHVQQRRQAWMERKKVPKSDNKCGGITAKCFQIYPAPRFFHKPSTYRYNQGDKLSCPELNLPSTCFILKMTPANRNSALSQSLFLPPIQGTDPGPSIFPRRTSPHAPGTTRVRAEENLPPSSPSLGPWQPKSESPRQAGDAEVERRTAPLSLELYRPCMETETTMSERLTRGGLPQQSPVPPAEAALADHSLTAANSKGGPGRKRQTTARGLGEKSSTWDSATESDSSCRELPQEEETDQRDTGTPQRDGEAVLRELESDQEGLYTLELEYYSTRRIMEWVTQVNRILFSPSCPTEFQEYPLTEQDTSIKIVYDGD
ncbi:hypothetical protein NDU88_008216 [Pleurodeles waltl]|uniref:Uncharacterized protein n=1 Tax=Pleurodeles waltl TaxID=8319 RepID=A0AAV7QTW7_PLEWA|nr:hypothetical protein NDU88_008216 [Pleurodeles waltl]